MIVQFSLQLGSRSAIRDKPDLRGRLEFHLTPFRLACKDLLRRRRRLCSRAVAVVDIVDHQRLEVGGNRRSAQGAELLAVDEDRRGRRSTHEVIWVRRRNQIFLQMGLDSRMATEPVGQSIPVL